MLKKGWELFYLVCIFTDMTKVVYYWRAITKQSCRSTLSGYFSEAY